MGLNASQIVSSQDQWLRMISGGEVVWGLFWRAGLKFKPWFSFGVTRHHQVHFEMKSGLPQTTFSCPQKVEKYKRAFCRLFYFILNIGHLEPWRDPRLSPAAQ
jgi:hypothetical protein